jgi:hypothetical protein
MLGTAKRTLGGIVNGSRTLRPSNPRTIFPLLVLIAVVVAMLVASASAFAWGEDKTTWEHGTATQKSSCDGSGCHVKKTSSNDACLLSGCHAAFTSSGGQKCWKCHRPGQSMTALQTASGCTTTCHTELGDRDSYGTTFSHGATPHLGASGYGKTCTDCHAVSTKWSTPGSSPHHDAAAGHQPTCIECHNGTLAKALTAAHATRSTNCASCHTGMSLPDCAGCHVGNGSSGGPQITYTNTLACGDAACHGKVANHSGTPILAAACTTCHAAHYEAIDKSCTKCHPSPQTFHHGTATATPLTDCAGCHNGGIAKAPVGHEGRSTVCTSCHFGMNRPSGDCATCHAKAQGAWPAVVFTNDLACGDARCHGKVKNHTGTPITAAACTTCHPAHYESLGACITCHADPQTFHHGTAKATPLADCAGCHNGAVASSHGNHGTLTSCTPCHGAGMDKPSVPSVCVKCHDVGATSTKSCDASGCHPSAQLHASGPAGGVDCTGCHTAHYKEIAPCTTCHPDRAGYHHKGVKTTPLTDCTTCHDGKIASAKKAHMGFTCATCHAGMARPPVPATCQNCHDSLTFGAASCTACHSATGMIGKETVHATDPTTTVSCTTCHKKHNADLGACETCHGAHAGTHHGTATLADTKLKLVASPARIKAHTRATLKGRLLAAGKALASESILIQRRVKGGSFKKVAIVKTGANGRFSRVVRPRAGTVYRAVWRPAGVYVTQQRPAITTVRLRVRK